MFDTVLHNHTRTVIGPNGQQVTQKATCADINGVFGSHVIKTNELDRNGKLRTVSEVVSCADADSKLDSLGASAAHLQLENGKLKSENKRLEANLANCERLMGAALKIIFGMGPALRSLLSEDLSDPTITDDDTAVKLEGVNYTIVFDVFKEKVYVRPVSALGLPNAAFSIRNGASALRCRPASSVTSPASRWRRAARTRSATRSTWSVARRANFTRDPSNAAQPARFEQSRCGRLAGVNQFL